MKETKKINQKFQIRVQTYEKKLELQQIKEQQLTAMVEKSNDEMEKFKLEQETYALLVRKKRNELFFGWFSDF